MDVVYGRPRTLEKFRVLELVARVPYQAWENVAYVAVTHTARQPGFARRVFDRVRVSRWEQDNEQWHLLILEELTGRRTAGDPWVKRAAAARRCWPSPTTSCRGSCTRSGRRGRTGSTPTSRTTPSTSTRCSSRSTRSGRRRRTTGAFTDDFGRYDSLADLFRQIGYDERLHKLESEHHLGAARFH